MLRAGSCAFLCMLLLGFSAPAPGTTVLSLGIEELTQLSDAVFVGTVVGVEVRATSPNQLLCTFAQIDVEQTLKGEVSPVVVVRQIGGRLGKKVVVVPGAPSFAEGERVLIFGARRGEEFLVTGFYQGKYSIQMDASGRSMAIAQPAGEGVEFLGNGEGATEKERTLSELFGEIRAAVRKGKQATGMLR